uniref:Ankyrin repeat protein n=1 Tax=Panagrolaimus sp. ES5 TaxID=591445 RepID=A0AC34FB13_9BILA
MSESKGLCWYDKTNIDKMLAVKEVIERGVNIQNADLRHTERVKLLMPRGAKLNFTTFASASSITLACAKGNFELYNDCMYFYFIGYPQKCDVLAPSPLMAAAFKNQPVIASYLLSRGTRTNYDMPNYSLDIISWLIMCSTATTFSTL